jgi:hypothetical protein
MGSVLIIVGEVVAPTSPAEAPPSPAACGGVSTLAAATGGEVVLLSTAPRGRVAVHASSASASPTTRGSGDLVREGEDGAPSPPCDLATGLHGETPRKKTKNLSSKRHNQTSRLYLVTTGSQAFGQNTRGLIVAGILACATAAVRCASNPRRRASSDVFCTSSHCLLAA